MLGAGAARGVGRRTRAGVAGWDFTSFENESIIAGGCIDEEHYTEETFSCLVPCWLTYILITARQEGF